MTASGNLSASLSSRSVASPLVNVCSLCTIMNCASRYISSIKSAQRHVAFNQCVSEDKGLAGSQQLPPDAVPAQINMESSAHDCCA